jgi:hypothetical protein
MPKVKSASTNVTHINGEDIKRVQDQTGAFISPNFAQDARVVIDRPELVKPGLRLGDWSRVEK